MFGEGGPVRNRVRSVLNGYVRFRPPEVSRRLAMLQSLVARAHPELFASSDLTRYELSVFSQNGEDGVLVEMLNRVGVGQRFFVEFGIEDGTQGNCVLLADILGWAGLFIESDPGDHALLNHKYAGTDVTVLCDLVCADRFTSILSAAGVPEEFDVLSIDIDGNDVYVWDALEGFRPRIVVIEYNSGIRHGGPVAQPHDPGRSWNGGSDWGASLAALDVVAARRGYRLAHTEMTGTNAFYVRADLWPLLEVGTSPRRTQNFGLTGLRQRPSDPPGGWVVVS